MSKRVDYVVVGAGSAGCVVAARLSETGAKVILLEAGTNANQLAVRIPALYVSLMDTEIDWGYRTSPQPELNNRRIFLSRGRGLGGTSLMNAMVYMRGNRGDYDHWRDLGNKDWGYDDVLPLFKRSERNESFGEPFHGTSGSLSVTHLKFRSPLTDLFMEACEATQLRRNDDVNGESQEGYGCFQMTADRHGRCSTDRAFLDPVRSRSNLEIVTNAFATRLLVEGAMVRGVEYYSGSKVNQLYPDGEVILCGGAINSPQLLMLSGIGPADHLRSLGIEVKHDLPGVGKNLQDHLLAGYRCEVSKPLSTFGMTDAAAQTATQEFLKNGTGPFATNFLEAGIFLRCDSRSTFPDVQVHFESDFGADRLDGTLTDRHGFAFYPNVARPKSRGELRLRTGNPLDKPEIDPRYLSDSADLDLTVDALIKCRSIGEAEPFKRVGAKEIWPGPAAKTRPQIAEHVRRTANTVWHPAGTCKMGRDELAVVDPALRVRGLEGLRVADASIMPTIVSGNTNAPCIMIGEKAADLVLGR